MGQARVSIILPVLDEVDFIDDAMRDLLGQEYPGHLEVVVADGGSTDGTRERLVKWSEIDGRVRVVDNVLRRQAYGVNAAAEVANGDILIRADGHSRYEPDYVAASVAALQEQGVAVGGRMNPVGSGRLGLAVAAAMNSPLTMGPGRFHHATSREEVDTVYLGAFHRADFEDLGGIRAFPSGSSEDADFYYRWRKSGRRVFVDPGIRSTYAPRESVGELWHQYFRYGQGKAEMLWVNGQLPSWRPLAPTLLILAIVATIAWGVFAGSWWPLELLLLVWLGLLIGVGLASGEPTLLVTSVAAVMHLAYGLGVIVGLVRGPARLRRLQ